MSDFENDSGRAATLFRSSKRRKLTARRKPIVEDGAEYSAGGGNEEIPVSPVAGAKTLKDEASIEEPAISDIVRMRKLKARRGGIGVTPSLKPSERGGDSASPGASALSKALVPTGGENTTAVDMAAKRFAPQTGLVADDLDQHM
jgi:hypothetical protein